MITKALFPNTFITVTMGSNKIHNVVIRADISPEKPRWVSRIGSITRIVPPGTPAAENFASTKENAK